jgi:hypothetical protein
MEGYYRTSSLSGYADNEVICLCSGCADFNGQNDFWEPIMEPDKCEICGEDVFGKEEKEFIQFLKESLTPDFQSVYPYFLNNLERGPFKKTLAQLFRDEKFKKECYIIGAFHWGANWGERKFWAKLHNSWIDKCFENSDKPKIVVTGYKVSI